MERRQCAPSLDARLQRAEEEDRHTEQDELVDDGVDSLEEVREARVGRRSPVDTRQHGPDERQRQHHGAGDERSRPWDRALEPAHEAGSFLARTDDLARDGCQARVGESLGDPLR
jgi:hypothetical protein